MASRQHSVLIIDDHDIVRFGLETLILSSPALELVGSAGTLARGLEMIAQRQPDLVLTDMARPDSNGLETVRAVVRAQAGRRTLVVSMQDEKLYGEHALALGADGYLMKDCAHINGITAALSVLSGRPWVSQELGARLMSRLARRRMPAPAAAPQPVLSVRELDVLELLRNGKSTKQIAAALRLSARTVDLHRANMKRKLGLRTGAELIAYASQKLVGAPPQVPGVDPAELPRPSPDTRRSMG